MGLKKTIVQFPVVSFFLLAFLLSWTGALLVTAPSLIHHRPVPKLDGLLMFPAMLAGIGTAAVLLTFVTGGRAAWKTLCSQLFRWKIAVRWYAIALLVPPVLILLTLLILSHVVSPAFTPNFFPVGILFGIPAGYIEEIGWTGYATQKMLQKKNTVATGIIVGLLWGLWHSPVIDFLGAATPHGAFLWTFFLSFIAVLIAMRWLMVWVYRCTGSILVVQVMHIVSTGSLVVLAPSPVKPAEEALWYAVYAVLLWVTVLIIYYAGSKREN